MKRNRLGKTDLFVSPLCFGSLTLSPLQKNESTIQAFKILDYAVNQGINFFDTADLYENYHFFKPLLKKYPDLILTTKSYDYTEKGLNKNLEKALKAIDRDYIDLFLLHEQESKYTFEGHQAAINALRKAQKEGKVRYIGFSTHRVQAVKDAYNYDFDVIFPLLNYRGLGIEDGSAGEMLKAIKRLRQKEVGIYLMKVLGGGNLIPESHTALEYAKKLLDEKIVDSISLGMQNKEEIDYNINFFINNRVDPPILKERKLHIEDYCIGCGSCVVKCHQRALRIENGKAKVDEKKCLTCGYCSRACPMFALKII